MSTLGLAGRSPTWNCPTIPAVCGGCRFRASLDARWTFLSDAERRYQAELGLRETTDTVQRPYLPASFLLSPDLSIHRVWNDWF